MHGFGKYGNKKRQSKLKIEDAENRPDKIIIINEETDNSQIDTSAAKIKWNINPINKIHCTTMSVLSNKDMSVVTVTSNFYLQTIPTYTSSFSSKYTNY